MLGSELLIAPVVKNGHRHVWVDLPEGEWVHLITGKRYRGGRQSVLAPLGVPAVFYLKGGEFEDLFSDVTEQIRQ
jgi:alpha-glucosidase